MQIFDDRKKRIGTLYGFKDRAITTTLDSGDKEMTFAYPASGALVGLLQEEYYIHTKTDEFVIKAVEKGEQFNKYTAVLNVEELEGTAFPYGFESDEQTIRACLEFAFEGTGWHVGTCTVTKKRTIDEQENVTVWDVLQKCLSTYRCECIIDSINKTVNIYERIGRDKGCYFIEGINLRKISLKSDTYDFYTRIYPIGKDGITPEWLTGKDYIDNFQYSSKVKAYVWKDERYTNTTSLIEDATAKIEEMSRPYKAYTAEVVDLAKASEEYKDILSYGIGDTVTLVSKKTRTKEKQRIVKITEYPETPKKNTVEISNARKTFADIQKEATAAATEEAISIANSNTKKVLKDGYYTKSDVESHITAAKDEISLGVSQVYETKKTVSEKVAAAEKNANAATDEKLTEYSTTEEMKSAIDMKADEINLGVSKTYETKTSVSEKITAANKTAQDAANAAEKNANAATDEKLTEYSTTEEMKTAIDMKADEINLGVSKTYETKTSVSEKITAANKTAQDAANAAEKNANAATDEKLTEYSTTEEMNSAIKVKAGAIESTVSKKVGSDEIISKINQSAEKVSINASKINFNGIVTANSKFKILTDGAFEANYGKIAGWKVKNGYIESKNTGGITTKLYSDGRIVFGTCELSTYGGAFTVKNGLHIYTSANTSSSGFDDGTERLKIFGLSHVTSGGHLVFDTDGSTVSYLSSSSKRYKEHVKNMTTEEAKKILEIPVVWFKYKKGYLNENDWLNNKKIPGFYAEDVFEIFKVATQLNEDGEPEDWNYRMIIPAMLKLIQELYEREKE